MTRHRQAFAFALLGFLLYTGPTNAQMVLDQACEPPSRQVAAAVAGYAPNQERAQTFTPGIAGNLAQVDLYVEYFFNPPVGNLIVEIRNTDASGFPDPAITPAGVLATSIRPATEIPYTPGGWVTFPLDTLVPQTPGTRLAITIRASPGATTFQWLGGINNPYPLGSAFERDIGNHNWIEESPLSSDYDLGFRTFLISAVPEPSVLLLGGGALGVSIWASHRYRQRRPRSRR